MACQDRSPLRLAVAQACFLLVAAGCAQVPNGPAPAAMPAAALPARTPSPDPATPEPAFAPTKAQILAVQDALAALGYDPGRRDGKWGPATGRALIAFEKDRGAKETDQLTAEIFEKIRLAASEGAITVHPGDLLIFSDGERKIADGERHVQWESDTKPALVAILPSMRGWPAAARAGLDWALSHALDRAQSDGRVKWSSTGVKRQFEIQTYASLTQKEAARIGGDPSGCRHFELRSENTASRYPGLACRDGSGTWYIPHSSVQFSRPASELSAGTLSASTNR